MLCSCLARKSAGLGTAVTGGRSLFPFPRRGRRQARATQGLQQGALANQSAPPQRVPRSIASLQPDFLIPLFPSLFSSLRRARQLFVARAATTKAICPSICFTFALSHLLLHRRLQHGKRANADSAARANPK
jgi:hypothetical protein